MKEGIDYIEVFVEEGVHVIGKCLKDAFATFRDASYPQKKLHIYYRDGKNLQFFVNREGYFEVETLNWI